MVALIDRPDTDFDVVTFGEVMAVFLADDSLPLAAANRFRRTMAGAEANVAVGLTRLGHRVGFATRFGDDPLGCSIAATLRGEGIRLTAATDPVRGTGILVRDVDGGRGRTDVAYGRAGSAASVFGDTDIPFAAWTSAAVLHLTGITAVLSDRSGLAVVSAAQRFRDQGTVICVDPNLRRRLGSAELFAERLAPLRGGIDIAVGDAEELCLLAGADVLADAEDRLLGDGARLVVIKKGAEGAEATDGRSRWEQPSMARTVVDPVGAGDALVAGLLSGLLDGEDVPTSLRRAAVVAASCIAVHGDIDGLPYRRHLNSDSEVDR